ncbi:MAG: alpha-L-rhamnosidase [Lentisphaeria bacterium]|nr:alpha-L-rhamnosidase [Lentisphaeria bacterium]
MKQAAFTDSEKSFLISQIPEWEKALMGNRRQLEQYPDAPVLLAGAQYPGIWLEHNQDNLFFCEYDPVCAWASQDIFMKHQREDGLLPFALPTSYKDPKSYFYPSSALFWHVQSIYPFVRCAMTVARKAERPEEDFFRIYETGKKYDDWLSRFRDHGQTGLVEMFCEYDTGHDQSPRVQNDGIPHTCPENDACNMPDMRIMPILSADLSAMRYGAREALAELAELLGRDREAALWREKAQETRNAIQKYLFDPEDDFYYDRDTRGFRKYRSEHITRLFLNKVLTQKEFDAIYDRYFTVEGKEFYPAYPIPSMSIDDPAFVKSCPLNSWGSNAQALTALRTLFWMDHYGRSSDQTALLSLWLRAFCNDPARGCRQEVNPFTGLFVDGGGKNYTPALILMIQAVKRLGWL